MLCLTIVPINISAQKRLGFISGKALGISFSYPRNWKYKSCEQDYSHNDCIGFKNRTSKRDYILTIELKDATLEQALDDHGLFEKIEGKWIKRGRFGRGETTAIAVDGWRGLYGIADCGISDQYGFHAAGGECLSVVMSNGKQALVIESDGKVDTNLVLKIVRSIKFTHKN